MLPLTSYLPPLQCCDPRWVQVLLVRHKRNGQLYAMKVMSKDHIIDKNHVRYTHSEREIMAKVG